jgi:hypothetical protein
MVPAFCVMRQQRFGGHAATKAAVRVRAVLRSPSVIAALQPNECKQALRRRTVLTSKGRATAKSINAPIAPCHTAHTGLLVSYCANNGSAGDRPVKEGTHKNTYSIKPTATNRRARDH